MSVKEPSAVTIDLLRHGEPEGGDKYRGSVDDPLSKAGWAQMRKAVWGKRPWDRIVTSPLKRCSEFARELGEECKVPVEIEEDFREMSFGDWEGRTREAILADDRDRLVSFWKNPFENPPPNGEPLDQLQKRVAHAWAEIVEAYPGAHILLVAHGGVIRMLLGEALGMPMDNLSRILVPYACVSRVRVETLGGVSMPRLVFHDGGI